MLDRLRPDRGVSEGTGTWSFVTPRPAVDYELPSIDHLPEPEPSGRHARRAGRHSAAGEAPCEDGEDLASERRLYFDLPAETPTRRPQSSRQPEGGGWSAEAPAWDADQQRWGGNGWGSRT
jgi:hypothetical protein